MKRYALFAKRSDDTPRPEGDYTIWYFLNDTDSLDEVYYWYQAAVNNKQYTEAQIVESVHIELNKR